MALALAGPARADPALFVIRGGAAPLYLFGSIHVLRPGLAWRTPKLARVLTAASGYWFETTDKPGPAMLLGLAAGMDLFHSLQTLLDPEDYRLLMQKLGLTGRSGSIVINHMRPWLAAMVILATDMQAETPGTSIAGVDDQLMAEAGGKPVLGLETLDDLVEMMNAMPQPDQVALLHASLHAPADAGGSMSALQDAWRAGDLDKLDRLTRALKTANPEMFDALLRQRNARWIGKLDGLLHGRAPVLVTVGAAHLVGPDGLPALLKQRGYRVVRLQ